MVGKININGQIGGKIQKEDGTEVDGFSLTDIIEQVTSQKGALSWEVTINSGGGSVEVGNAIADYIQSLGDITTIADEV
jgi:ATP-dependent protease ClpP protease subunit